MAGQNQGDAPTSPKDQSGTSLSSTGDDPSKPEHKTIILAPEDRPGTSLAAQVKAQTSWQAPGFRVIRMIGEGGMGSVYEAEQEQPPRPVALKVIRASGSADPYLKRLFEREVNILAKLHHPGIAPIYECGETTDGQRFFAMELIVGKSLDVYAREFRATNPAAKWQDAAISLFLEVCEAVIYAHQQGVVHRDLKPTNILVRNEAITPSGTASGRQYGRIAMLDFGLARLVTESNESRLTAAGSIQGTLAYMSPEQIAGRTEAIDTRSDLYSLAVILYELLCGRLPYDLKGLTLSAAASVILNEAPANTTLDKDLDTILRKALAKTPKERYRSVSEFAEDLVRFREKQPIQARPPSALYQLRKLVERHRATSAAVALLFLTLVGSIAALAHINRRVVQERDRADLEAATATQTVAFLTHIFELSDPSESRGNTVTAREILDQGSKDIESLLGEQPEVRSRLQLAMGDVYRNLGLYKQAQELIERAVRTRRLHRPDAELEMAHALDRLGDLLRERGDNKSAKAPLETALEIRKRLLPPDSVVLASSLNNYGLLLYESRLTAEAEPYLRRALEIRTAKQSADHPDRLVSLSNMVGLLKDTGKLDAAEAMARELIAMREKSLGPDHPHLSNAYSRLAAVLVAAGKHPEAQAALRHTLAIRAKSAGSDHPATNLARTNLASELQDFGRYAEAESLYRQAIQSHEKNGTTETAAFGLTLNNLSSLLEDVGQYDEAAKLSERSLTLRRRLSNDESATVIRAELNLARLEFTRGRIVEAEALLTKAMPRASKIPSELARARILLGQVRARQGKTKEAEELLRAADSWNRANLPAADTRLLRGATRLGLFLVESGRAAEAENGLRETYQNLSKHYGTSNRLTIDAGLALADCLDRLGKRAEAQPLRQRSVAALQGLRAKS